MEYSWLVPRWPIIYNACVTYRCRLRKKSWKNPGQVYYDHQRFEDTMSVVANWEVFLQEVPCESVVQRSPSTPLPELVLFVRRWRPSKLALGPFQEVELDSTAGEELRGKVSLLCCRRCHYYHDCCVQGFHNSVFWAFFYNFYLFITYISIIRIIPLL